MHQVERDALPLIIISSFYSYIIHLSHSPLDQFEMDGVDGVIKLAHLNETKAEEEIADSDSPLAPKEMIFFRLFRTGNIFGLT